MYDISFVDAMTFITGVVLWATIMNGAILVNVCCWAVVKWIIKETFE